MHNLVPFQQEQSCLTNKQKSLSETLNQGHLRISWSIPPIPPTLVFCLLYFSLVFLSFFVFCISYRFVCCIFLPVREPYCSSSPSPTSFKWDPVCQEIEFKEEKSRSRAWRVCSLDHLCLRRLPPHTGQSGLAHAQTTPATPTTPDRVVRDSTKVFSCIQLIVFILFCWQFFFFGFQQTTPATPTTPDRVVGDLNWMIRDLNWMIRDLNWMIRDLNWVVGDLDRVVRDLNWVVGAPTKVLCLMSAFACTNPVCIFLILILLF